MPFALPLPQHQSQETSNVQQTQKSQQDQRAKQAHPVQLPSIRNLIVPIYPELAAAALRCGLAEQYVLWSLWRIIDKSYTAEGRCRMGPFLNWMKSHLGITSRSARRALIQKGDGHFWFAPKSLSERSGGRAAAKKTQEAFFGLRSMTHVVEHVLTPGDVTPSRPFEFVMQDFWDLWQGKGCSGDVSALLTSVVAARSSVTKPISKASIAELVGLSERTVQRDLKRCPLLVSASNYVFGAIFHSAGMAQYALRRAREGMITSRTGSGRDSAAKFFVFDLQEGRWCVGERIPNTYSLPAIRRGSMRSRPRELRKHDNWDSITSPKYAAKSEAKQKLAWDMTANPATLESQTIRRAVVVKDPQTPSLSATLWWAVPAEGEIGEFSQAKLFGEQLEPADVWDSAYDSSCDDSGKPHDKQSNTWPDDVLAADFSSKDF